MCLYILVMFNFMLLILRRQPISILTYTLFPTRRSSDLSHSSIFWIGMLASCTTPFHVSFESVYRQVCELYHKNKIEEVLAVLKAFSSLSCRDRKSTRLNSSH